MFSPRIEAGYEFSFPLYLGFMASTLRINSDGTLDRNVDFDRKTFTAGTDVEAHYRFDSYRATARYYFYEKAGVRVGAGFTGKIRDAEITLEGGGQKGGLSNTGFAPLLNFYAEWNFYERFYALFCGDGSWSPYGRAEDFFAGLEYRAGDNYSVMAGYRMLEGGADNDRVYTFSMFHYAVIGINIRI